MTVSNELEFREEKIEVSPGIYSIKGSTEVRFCAEYLITDEAIVRGLEDMQRQYAQEKCHKHITDGIIDWSMDYIRENAPKTEKGVSVFVTRRVPDRILLMHPREYGEFLGQLPKKISIAHQMGMYTFGDKEMVAFTDFDLSREFINSIYQAVSDFLANTMSPGHDLKVIVPIERFIACSRDAKMARELLEDMEGQRIFNAAGYEVYSSSKVNEMVVIEQ